MRRTPFASTLITAAFGLAIFPVPSAAVTFTVFGPDHTSRCWAVNVAPEPTFTSQAPLHTFEEDFPIEFEMGT